MNSLQPSDQIHISVTQKIRAAREAFLTYNISRLRELIRYLSPEKLELFHSIPFLLHINHPDFPGYLEMKLPPCGIYKFEKSGLWKIAIKAHRIKTDALPRYLSRQYHIHGIYLMGSSGTIGQTHYSDFDYWLLIDESTFQSGSLKQLERKLSEIEHWSKTVYQQQVKFFILDINQIRDNNFSAIDSESSGTAQKTLLKEEFYRTFIMIAGRIPYWAVLPVGLSDSKYNQWINTISQSNTEDRAAEDYIDLGGLESINQAECLGALLWQIYKSRTDPVKSLIKSSLVTYYSFFGHRDALLCDKVKQRFSERQLDSYLVDPYLVIFEKILDFFEYMNDPQGLELIKECIILRLSGYPFLSMPKLDSPKQELLNRLFAEWAWEAEKIDRFEQYTQWSENEKLAFDELIFDKLMFLYELILRSQDRKNPPFDMTLSDLKTLTNRIAVWFQKKPSKIEHCSTFLRAQMKNRLLSISCNVEGPCVDRWEVYDGTSSGKDGDSLLYSGQHLIRVIGWILLNGLHAKKISSIVFEPNACTVTAHRAKQLFTDACQYFSKQPFESEKPESEKPESKKIDQPEKLLVTLDAREDGDTKAIVKAEFLLENIWNEFHFWSINLARVENPLLKCYRVAMEILTCMKRATEEKFQYKIEPLSAIVDNHNVQAVEDLLTKLRQGSDSAKSSRAATRIKPEELMGKPLLDRIDGHTA
jgi:adenylate cyclase class 1